MYIQTYIYIYVVTIPESAAIASRNILYWTPYFVSSFALCARKVRVQCAAQRPTVSPTFVCQPSFQFNANIYRCLSEFAALLKFPSYLCKVHCKCSRRSTRMRWTNRGCRIYKLRKWELYLGRRMYPYICVCVCVCVRLLYCVLPTITTARKPHVI